MMLMRALVVLVVMGAPAGAQSLPPAGVSGVVQDQTAGVLPQARVELLDASDVILQSTSTDAARAFHFDVVAPGTYRLRATFQGFQPTSVRIRVAARPITGQKLVLPLADLKQSVSVDNGSGLLDASAANNLNAVTLDKNMLESLPMMDQDLIATLSRFLDAASLGGGGPTIVVNGMEVSALRVSASAVQQVKINQDPYAAEYGRPGRGRIEILTKPGGQRFHGELNTVVRDAHLDARNAFAPTKPAEQKRIFEGVFSGPVGRSGKTSFLLSAQHQRDDQQAVVFAAGPAGTVRAVVAQPSAQALIAATVTHQASGATLISITPNYEYEASDNRGVGGVTLASAGSDFRHHEQQLRYTQQNVWRPTLVNQFQILVGHEREPTTSVSSGPGVMVADAFTGGGAQADLVRTEVHMQLVENLTWTRRAHAIQVGFQLPDWSRRGFDDRTNFGGTYFFSDLDTFAAGQPYAYTVQRGDGHLALLEKQVGAYVKDDWRVRSNLSISVGLRYDWQNFFRDDNNLSPRVSLAYAPRGSKRAVLRGGAGLFTDRSGPVILAELMHSERGDLVRYVLTQPTYPAPPALSTGAAPVSVTRLAPGVQIPRTAQYSVNVDGQLGKGLTLSVGYTGARGYDLFRSRDVNAPRPPLYLTRPDPAYGAIRQIDSTGRQSTDALQLVLRGQITHWFNGQTQYTLGRAWNDTNGLGSYPANDYDLTGEWARADFDRRHRLVLIGRVSAGKLPEIGVGLTMNSAGTYTEWLGGDPYNNGRGRARPSGVTRNSLSGASYAQLDLRVSRELTLARVKDGPALAFALDAFNLTNRVNEGTFVGTVGSPLFGRAISARPPRQLQLTAKLTF